MEGMFCSLPKVSSGESSIEFSGELVPATVQKFNSVNLLIYIFKLKIFVQQTLYPKASFKKPITKELNKANVITKNICCRENPIKALSQLSNISLVTLNIKNMISNNSC